jgi:hypothetical protein
LTLVLQKKKIIRGLFSFYCSSFARLCPLLLSLSLKSSGQLRRSFISNNGQLAHQLATLDITNEQIILNNHLDKEEKKEQELISAAYFET